MPRLAAADVTVQFSLGHDATATANSIIQLAGTITNNSTTTPFYGNNLFDLNIIPSNQIASVTPESVTIDQASGSGYLPLIIGPGQQFSGDLLNVNISASATLGDYLGMYGLSGGSDANATSVLATQYFVVHVTGSVPAEPGSPTLSANGSSTTTFVGLQMPGNSGSVQENFSISCSGGLCMQNAYSPGPRLIKLDGDSTVYWVSSNNIKIPMLSAKVFLSYNNQWSDVQTVGQQEYDYYPTAKYIWLNGGGAIYLIKNGIRRYIPSAIWNPAGIDASQIINVNKTDFNSYSTGPDVSSVEELTAN